MGNIKIKQLSKSEQIVGVITCPASKVSVLRAKSMEELLPYKKALSNIPQADNFLIEEDDKKLDLNNIVCIGIVKEALDETSVKEYLNYSENEDSLLGNAKQLQLNRVLDSKLSDLSECEFRRVEILKLSLASDNIVAINLPFEPISFSLKETVAEFLLDICVNQNHTVIVTAMDFRPKSWIDNKNINRVEVGQNRHKTIGFGDAPSELQAMLEEVRKESSEKPAEASFLDSPLDSLQQPRKKRPASFLIGLALVFLVGSGFYFFNSKDTKQQIAKSDSAIEEALSTKENKQEIKTKKEEIKKVQYAINYLPADIKKSIISTFQGTSESINYKKQKTKSKTKTYKKSSYKNESAGDSLLQALQKTSNTAKETPKTYGRPSSPGRTISSPSGSSMSTERREMLRQKFKEALKRATKK